MKCKLLCQECNSEFESNQNRKFCSRSCYAKEDSRRKKEKFKDQPHHTLGRKATKEECDMRSKKTADTWNVAEIRTSRINGMKRRAEINGAPIGWDLAAIDKRNKTIELNGGHNLIGTYGSRKCDITFMERYGMTSHEYRTKKLRETVKTKPELKLEELLTKLNIDFIFQYKFKNRYFDFAIESKKILIEVDGNYWHSKDIVYEDMNDQQKTTFHNDIYKNNLVKKSEWKLIRIWESDLTIIDLNKLRTILYE